MNSDDPQDQSTPAPWATGSPQSGLSTTPDDSITNQQLNKIATDLGSQSVDMVAALNAIATAINAKPSA